MGKKRVGKAKIDAEDRLLLVLLRYDLGWFEKGQLADALGVAPSLVSMWERGERRIPREALGRTADRRGFPRPFLPTALQALRAFRTAAEGKVREPRAVDLLASIDLLPLLVATTDLLLGPVDRAERTTEEEPAETEDLWSRLARHTPAERRLLVEEGEEYRTQALWERAEAESAALKETHPRQSREWEELAKRMRELAGASSPNSAEASNNRRRNRVSGK